MSNTHIFMIAGADADDSQLAALIRSVRSCADAAEIAVGDAGPVPPRGLVRALALLWAAHDEIEHAARTGSPARRAASGG